MDIIVEIGNSHEGSLGIATSFIKMAKNTGANCVKFQMHLAEFEGMNNEPFRESFSSQDSSRQEYWKRVNFTFENWKKLAKYASEQQLEFLCTPFSLEAASWLSQEKLVRRWKVGSGDATNYPLIDYLISTKLPLIISTGLISWQEIIDLKSRLVKKSAWERTTLMHCISKYPTKIEESSLNLISDLKSLGCKVGLSDHSGNWRVPLKAISMGIETLEIHMKPHDDFFGPDVASSLTPDMIERIVETEKQWKIIDDNKGDKEIIFEQSSMNRKIFRKGIYWSNDKSVGEIVKFEDFKYRKPVVDLDASEFEKYIGKRIAQPVSRDSPVVKADLDES